MSVKELKQMKFAGIHLSGANAHKTSVVLSFFDEISQTISISKVYEKIGSIGNHFSDERLYEVLTREAPFVDVIIDCPLSYPPCVSCLRDFCPSVTNCEDVNVAYMISLTSKHKFKRSKRHRPVNPQQQRLYDVWRLVNNKEQEHHEPTFSANLAPLVTRAKTLQKRLNHYEVSMITLAETSVLQTLVELSKPLGLDKQIRTSFRNFEEGFSTREQILKQFHKYKWIDDSFFKSEWYDLVLGSVENFQAFISNIMGVMKYMGLSQNRPAGFPDEENWVFIPQLYCELPNKRDMATKEETSHATRYLA